MTLVFFRRTKNSISNKKKEKVTINGEVRLRGVFKVFLFFHY